MFYLDQKHNLAVAQIPRCGLNTIAGWLGGEAITVQNNSPDLLRTTRRVAFIRDPIDRLGSAFSLFYWMAQNQIQGHVSGAPVDRWESFIDYILDNSIPDDEHWLPQSAHIESVPNIYHRFENIAERFELYRPGILPHKGRTSRRPTTHYRMSEIVRKYADDFALRIGLS